MSLDDMLTRVHFSFVIILKRKKSKKGGKDQEMLQSSTIPGCFAIIVFVCIVTINVLWLFLTVPWVGLQYVVVVFPDHTHLSLEISYFLQQQNRR